MSATYWHVRKEDLHGFSALAVNPPFPSFDVVLRRDYDELAERLRVLSEALRRIAQTAPDDSWSGFRQAEIAREALAGGGQPPEPDPTEGLPPDLAAVLRDPSIIVPQDASVFKLVAEWMDAPSNTASGSVPVVPEEPPYPPVWEAAEIVLREALDDDDAVGALQLLQREGFVLSRVPEEPQPGGKRLIQGARLERRA